LIITECCAEHFWNKKEYIPQGSCNVPSRKHCSWTFPKYSDGHQRGHCETNFLARIFNW
jgi:hypothetical protein